MTEEQLTDKMAQMIRVGFVAGRQPERMRVKVEFRDTTTTPLVSDWLPVLTPRAHQDKEYDLPDDGDQVLCLFLPFGLEQGFVIGSMYGRESPPVKSGDKWHKKFRDGASLEYDRAEHKLSVNIPGDIIIKADGLIKINAGHVSIQE
jgi:phage baseplate assembly protein V